MGNFRPSRPITQTQYEHTRIQNVRGAFTRLRKIWLAHYINRSWSSSGSIVSDYGLDDQAIGIRSPEEEKDFPLASVSRPALSPTQPPLQWVPGVLSQGLKRGWGVTLTTHPHLLPKSGMSRRYTSSPSKRLRGV
jgi:hypothetical protein